MVTFALRFLVGTIRFAEKYRCAFSTEKRPFHASDVCEFRAVVSEDKREACSKQIFSQSLFNPVKHRYNGRSGMRF